jgi:hypothetical protein
MITLNDFLLITFEERICFFCRCNNTYQLKVSNTEMNLSKTGVGKERERDLMTSPNNFLCFFLDRFVIVTHKKSMWCVTIRFLNIFLSLLNELFPDIKHCIVYGFGQIPQKLGYNGKNDWVCVRFVLQRNKEEFKNVV